MAELSTYEDRVAKALAAKEKKYEAQIALLFKQALDDIRVEMAKVYEKYAVNGILTKGEMTKYSRLTALEKNLVEIINPAVKQTQALLYRIPPEVYGDSFFLYAWAVDQAISANLTWGPLNKEAVIANLDNPIDKLAIAQYGANTRVGVKRALNTGLIAGQSYTQMMKDLKKFINVTNFQALRILRTEGATAQNAGQTDSYAKARAQGVAGVDVWQAALDSRTRYDHGQADGQERGADGMFSVGGEKTPYPAWAGLSAGNRINCRCLLRMQIRGYEPQLRRIRGEGVMPYQVYSSWKAERKTWK